MRPVRFLTYPPGPYTTHQVGANARTAELLAGDTIGHCPSNLKEAIT
jgi:hypothetical protein